MNALTETNFNLPGQTHFYKGKVRDVYSFKNYLLMVASDRISAFDVVLPNPIPFKGQVLNQLAAKNLEATKHIVPNWLMATPDPNVSIGIKCEAYPVEMVIRGYLAGHAWREYRDGKRVICGVAMPDGLKENDPFPSPIITPTTKAHQGHDEDISREEIIKQGLVDEDEYLQLENYTNALFTKGTEMAKAQGLILVDTKYEFGINDDTIYLIDEIHTPDSSRYFYLEGFEERQQNDEPQKQLSKEFVRQWLISEGFQGLEGQSIPKMTEDKINQISNRYIELYERFTGYTFNKASTQNIPLRIEKNILEWIKLNNHR